MGSKVPWSMRSGSITNIKSTFRDTGLGSVANIDLHNMMSALQTFGNLGNPNVRNRVHVVALESIENYSFVDAIDQFGTQALSVHLHGGLLDPWFASLEVRRQVGDDRGSQVGGHDHYGITEINFSTMSVGQPTVIEQLHSRFRT